MAGSRTLKLSILADVDNLKKELDKGSKEVEGFGGKLEKFSGVAKAAFAAAGAAAAAYAGKLLVDGVKAAIEDEKANAQLAATLRNVTTATEDQIEKVLEYTRATELATGVTEDELRPSLNRLAIATGDVEKAIDLQTLALDVSAGSGKGLEAVTQALAKAYEGNTASLGRLGIGLSTAELSAMSFEEITQSLSDTFEGQADVAAETFEGRINRLKLSFEDVRDSVGERVLPIIEKLLKFITETAIPKLQEFKKTAIDPVIKAFKDNEATLRSLYEFGKSILVPFLSVTLGNAIKGLATVASGIVSAVSIALRALEPIINAAIAGINAIIRAKNFLTGSNTPTVQPISFSGTKSAGSNTVPSASLPSGVTVTPPSLVTSGGTATGPTLTTTTPKVTPTTAPKITTTTVPTQIPPGSFDVGSFRQAEERDRVTINVNGAIDPASTARQIVDLLNSEASVSGSFSNLGVSRFATRAE